MTFLQPFRNPIPSESWAQYIIEAPLAGVVSPSDDLALLQSGAIKRLPLSAFNPSTLVVVVAITSGGLYQVTATSNVIAVKKTIPSITTIMLESSPADGRQLQIGDWAGNASGNQITINGNGKLIRDQATSIIAFDWQSYILTYSSVLGMWNST